MNTVIQYIRLLWLQVHHTIGAHGGVTTSC